MQPDAVAGNTLDPQINRRDMQFELLEERRLIQMVEETMPFHRQVRGIDLQDRPRLVNGPIFVRQRFRQRHQISLVAIVMLV